LQEEKDRERRRVMAGRGRATKPGHKHFARDIRFNRAREGLNLSIDWPSARLMSSLPIRYATGGLPAQSG